MNIRTFYRTNGNHEKPTPNRHGDSISIGCADDGQTYGFSAMSLRDMKECLIVLDREDLIGMRDAIDRELRGTH